MIIPIDIDRIKENGITVRMFMFLLSLYREDSEFAHFDFQDADYLESNGYIKVITTSDRIIAVLRQDGIDLIHRLLGTSETVLTDKFIEELRDIFPQGKKVGTSYYWRDSKAGIRKRMIQFFKKYGNTWTEEQILDASKRYVSSFDQSSRKYMQLLKYFIFKDDNSALLSELENKDNIEDNGTEWDRTVV